MHRLLTVLCICALALVSFAGTSRAQLHTIETDDLRLIYNRAPHHFLAPHAVRCFENAMSFHRDLFDYEPYEKITVLLHDQSDFANAGATSAPLNAIIVAIAPFSYVYETTSANERINLIMSHELVHIVAADRPSGSDRFFRKLFWGKVRETEEAPISMIYGYLTTPRRNSPRWYHEGLAVFLETWMAGGMGRAQGAYDEMVFRAKVRDSADFYDPVGLEAEGTKIDFQGGVNSYLYGTRFMSYLALTYGPEKVIEWVTRDGGTRRYFGSQFKKVFGRSLDDVWNDWVVWEHAYQNENLDSIRQYPITPHRDISRHALGSVSRTHLDPETNRIYAAVNFPGQIAHIAAIDLETGDLDRLCDVKGEAMYYVTSLAYDSVSGTLYYTADNYEWRDLCAVDVRTGRQRTLQKDVRVGDLAYSAADSTLWGIRHYNGISTLVQIRPPYDDWDQVHTWTYGTDVYDLAVSPDGRYLTASKAEITGRQTLILLEIDKLRQKQYSARELFDFGYSIPESFTFTADGNYLYGSSYYTGASNIFRYDLAADSMECMTNCEAGFFRPMPAWEDSIVVLRFTGEGFVPAVIPVEPLEDVAATRFLGHLVSETHPVVKSWMMDPPSSVNLDSVVTDSGAYHALSNISVASLYPIVEGYKDYVAYGLRAEIGDPILMHNIKLSASYSPYQRLPSDEQWHFSAQWKHMYWTLGFDHNGADFYDLFGPAKRSRKGNALSLAYNRTLINDAPKSLGYSVSVAGYKDLEELPFYQDVPTTFDKFATFGFDVNYGNKRASLGAVDYTKGIGWQFISSNQWVKDRVYAQFVNNLDLGTPLPIKNSSAWLRTSTGYSTGRRNDPQANFFFGGFRNNYVDFRTERRYRKYYTFPGADINSIGGINFAKALLEWNLPPLRFGRLGTSSAYGERIRMALFGSGLVTNWDRESERRVMTNAGAQLELRFQLLSHYQMTFSVGYAQAFEKDQKPTEEWRFSLKIL